jgi:hypothetical protein
VDPKHDELLWKLNVRTNLQRYFVCEVYVDIHIFSTMSPKKKKKTINNYKN